MMSAVVLLTMHLRFRLIRIFRGENVSEINLLARFCTFCSSCPTSNIVVVAVTGLLLALRFLLLSSISCKTLNASFVFSRSMWLYICIHLSRSWAIWRSSKKSFSVLSCFPIAIRSLCSWVGKLFCYELCVIEPF